MERSILTAFLLSLVLQCALVSNGAAIIAVVAGGVEAPHLLTAVAMAGLACVQALLLVVYFLTERAVVAGAIARHIARLERAIAWLFSPHAERRRRSAEVISEESAERDAIYRDGVWRAFKFFGIAGLLTAILILWGGQLLAAQWGAMP